MVRSPKIWLTGSRGFIGRPLVRAFKDDQADLTCFTHEELDYLDPADIEDKIVRLGKPDILILMGWGQIAAPDSPFHLAEGVQGARNLINTAFKLGVKKVIFTGTTSQYGGRVGLLSEDMEPQGKLTNYARAKNEVERSGFEAARKYGKIFICVRLSYVFGAGQRQGSLINDLYQAHLKKTSVSLSPCEHYRDYVHVLDVVEGLRRICSVEESTTVNLASGKVVRVRDFVIDLWKGLGGDIENLKFGMRTLNPGEPDQPKSYADLTRLKALTQWQPALSLQEGIIKTIEGLSVE
jgi:nucleoside-diphosphate-sugar epimerase